MCDWEEFIFGCSCSYTKRKNYCHFARNDPNHQCFGVQVLKKVWDVPEACEKCSNINRAAMQATAPNGWSHQYVAQESSEWYPISFSHVLVTLIVTQASVVVDEGRADRDRISYLSPTRSVGVFSAASIKMGCFFSLEDGQWRWCTLVSCRASHDLIPARPGERLGFGWQDILS